jgi:hypothetical protein
MNSSTTPYPCRRGTMEYVLIARGKKDERPPHPDLPPQVGKEKFESTNLKDPTLILP